ncbi:hypothetical protein D9756_003074 [Leucocoprinus leucothites]|uniref:NACHT domain-containing protein n=1 Tax=Leucocoprinus leucothites TaxID=201217 RepID=A0A8H5G6J7_9AGAR|nr:hypothetical protein D9756_003074 [Leucoagaricus leucothites]
MSPFSNAHDFQVKDSLLVDQSSTQITNVKTIIKQPGQSRVGLQKLLENSVPGASHDSSDRYPPPLCHPGTREDYIAWIEDWALNPSGHSDRIMWVKGPAGVGKSAIAQSCAERLAISTKLGASFFFSRPHRRDDPKRFFTSIAYQLAVKYRSYGELLDEAIHLDPTLLKKSLPSQFNSLLVAPIDELKLQGKDTPEKVIIVDGLDECDGVDAQRDIVKVVAQSVQDQTTPYLWIFFSRLEPHLVMTFDSPRIDPLTARVELTISRDIDQQILLFLRDKLHEIGLEHGLGEWPSDRDILILVDLSSGLFAYASTVTRFIEELDSSGPQDQLDLVLRLARHKTPIGHKHPLSSLDLLYMLILERLPPKKLQLAQWIFIAYRLNPCSSAASAAECANLLRQSEQHVRNACQPLHSVMFINKELSLQFYHTSFLEFLEDPARSNDHCIWSTRSVLTFLDHLLDTLTDHIYTFRCFDGLYPYHPSTWETLLVPPIDNYTKIVYVLFRILQLAPLAGHTARVHALQTFDFRRAALNSVDLHSMKVKHLLQNLRDTNLIQPCRFRNVIETTRKMFTKKKRSTRHYTIGHGDKKALLSEEDIGNDLHNLWIKPYSARQTTNLRRQLPDFVHEDDLSRFHASTPSLRHCD